MNKPSLAQGSPSPNPASIAHEVPAAAEAAISTDLTAYTDEELVKKLPGFTNHYATVNGVRLHYVEGGSGQPDLDGHNQVERHSDDGCEDKDRRIRTG